MSGLSFIRSLMKFALENILKKSFFSHSMKREEKKQKIIKKLYSFCQLF